VKERICAGDVSIAAGWGFISGSTQTFVAKPNGNAKESNMKRLLTCTAVAVLLGFTPVLAADNSAPPTQPGVSPEASKSAHQPQSGSADTSAGAKEQSSAPPASGTASATKPDMDAMAPSSGSLDKSRGAKEQSSAPPGSSAAETSKPNPTIGSKSYKE